MAKDIEKKEEQKDFEVKVTKDENGNVIRAEVVMNK